MKKILTIILTLALMLLCSCERDIGAAHMGIDACIVAYCMPTTSDTTEIQVMRSVSMDEYTVENVEYTDTVINYNYDDDGNAVADTMIIHRSETTHNRPAPITNARISYKVNGVEQLVSHQGEGRYAVVCKQQPGDRIDLTIEADGLKTVTAQTTLPDTVAIDRVEMAKVELYDPDQECSQTYDQLRLTFTDSPLQGDYYAVRVVSDSYQGTMAIHTHDEYGVATDYPSNFDLLAERYSVDDLAKADSVKTYIENFSRGEVEQLFTRGEPVLDSRSSLDDMFDNDYMGNFYIFDDSYFNGRTYTLKLNLSSSSVMRTIWREHTVELYRITPEYYRFVKSINDMRNNDLAEYGLSQIAPTLSNLHGGVGLLGGMACTRRTGISIYPEYRQFIDLNNIAHHDSEIYY